MPLLVSAEGIFVEDKIRRVDLRSNPGRPKIDPPYLRFTAEPLASRMAIETIAGFSPTIHESAFIAASADVIGRVTLHEESSVWYNSTLRGDINEIVIGPRSNVQDNAVIHLSDDYGCYIGELVTVGHSAILHACTVKDEVLIGMGSIVLDGAVIGERSIIGAGGAGDGRNVYTAGFAGAGRAGEGGEDAFVRRAIEDQGLGGEVCDRVEEVSGALTLVGVSTEDAD